jgi:hypothetical protein
VSSGQIPHSERGRNLLLGLLGHVKVNVLHLLLGREELVEVLDGLGELGEE